MMIKKYFAIAAFSVLAAAVGIFSFMPKGLFSSQSAMAKPVAVKVKPAKLAKAYFAGGCFWCSEEHFEKLPAVYEAISGYTGGDIKNPTYRQVGAGLTRHFEAVEVQYDPTKISYRALVDYYWRHIDPTDGGGQFGDRGRQYQPAIFPTNDMERMIAIAARDQLNRSGFFNRPVAVKILPFKRFWKAEERHQNYYRLHPIRYGYYARGSGRKGWVAFYWKGKPSLVMKSAQRKPAMKVGGMKQSKGFDAASFRKPADSALRQSLSPLEYNVTQKAGTERPFSNKYWDNKKEGIYVDIVSGEPLFSSLDKFKSGTGWPSFVKPITKRNVAEHEDNTFFSRRTEVRSKHANSHLGHVFTDGPKNRGGLRYCINSASLRFVPLKEMEKQGYGKLIAKFLPRGSGNH